MYGSFHVEGSVAKRSFALLQYVEVGTTNHIFEISHFQAQSCISIFISMTQLVGKQARKKHHDIIMKFSQKVIFSFLLGGSLFEKPISVDAWVARSMPGTTGTAPFCRTTAANPILWRCDTNGGLIFSGTDIRLDRRRRRQSLLQHLSPSSLRSKTDDDEDEDDDDDVDDIFSKGVDSVAWLPTVKNARGIESVDTAGSSVTKGSELIPLFPLGGIVYTPNSEHILNIFEPRYRQMYTDILMNGTKRFAVAMSHPTESGRFAQMAVLFELDDLKEVSEQTGDQIKYICNHKVTGRVKLHRILNPQDWESRATYLQAEGTVIDDSGKHTSASTASGENIPEQKLLQTAFGKMVDLQFELEEDVRFTRASVLSLSVQPGSGPDGLWQTIKLWQSFADQRLMARQNELQGDFQEKLQDYLKKEKGLNGKELPR
jgi:hypothetical protein